MPKQILHESHKAHPLVLCDTGSPGFTCNGCRCAGRGFRYRCATCDFDLHEFCATCPPSMSFFFHGQHPLTLEPAVSPDNPRRCDLCNTAIQGMYYSCRPCGFDVHPVCSQLPVTTVSPLHPEHLVTLTVASLNNCSHCEAKCLWRYRCGPCKVHLHPKCLLGTDKTPLCIPKDR